MKCDPVRKRYISYLVVLALYILLALALTWPLAAHLVTHAIGSATWAFDEYTFVWNMWWFKFSLLNLGQTPLHTNYIFYPLGIDLVSYTLNLFNGMLGLPLQLALPLPLASNVVILFTYIMSGFGGYLLACYLLTAKMSLRAGAARLRWPAQVAAFVAGAAYAFSAARMVYAALGHYNVLTAQWFPFYALFLVKTWREPGWRNPVLAGLWTTLILLAEPFFGVFWLFLTVLLSLFEVFRLAARQAEGTPSTSRRTAPPAEGTDQPLSWHLSRTHGAEIASPSARPHSGKFISSRPQGDEATTGPYSVSTVSGGADRHRSAEANVQTTAARAAWLRMGTPLLRLLAMGLIAAFLWSPVLLAMVRAFGRGEFELSGWGNVMRLSADVVGWFTPTALHPLFGVEDWPAYLRAVVEGKTMFQDVNTVFLGYGILLLAVIGALSTWRQARAWVWGAAIFAVFTLGPLLQIKGQFLFPLDNLLREQGIPQDVTFPLPFALLHYIPFLKANRVPNRFSVILSLALAVLVAYGVFALLSKLASRSRISRSHRAEVAAGGIVLLVLALFDQLAAPLPLTDAHIPAPYEAIAADTDDYAIMTIPFGWRDSFGTKGAERTQVQYYQSYHRKRLITGNTSRAPQFKFDYYLRIPLFRALTAVELYNSVDEETLARAREQAGELMALYDVRYLVVHEPVPLRFPEADTTDDALALARELMPLAPKPQVVSEGVSVYRVLQPPLPDPLRIDFGQWRAAPYRGEGWGDDEDVFAATANWAVGHEAQVFFPVRGSDDHRLTIHIAPFVYPGSDPQTLSLQLNGQSLAEAFTLAEGWQVVEATLPARQLRSGLNILTLSFSRATPPAAVLDGSGDTRPLAAAVDWLSIARGN